MADEQGPSHTGAPGEDAGAEAQAPAEESAAFDGDEEEEVDPDVIKDESRCCPRLSEGHLTVPSRSCVFEGRLQAGADLRKEGNEAFKSGDLQGALR